VNPEPRLPTAEPAARAGEPSDRRWEPRRAGRSAGDWAKTSYYGVPVIHKPHWKWLIITYFFLGGIAGGSYVIASIAELVGSAEDQRITRAGRFLSLAALLPCPILLILDLGRPERFLNMLRVVKLRSPMSLGTWGLTAFGGFCTLSALTEAAEIGLLGEDTRLARLVRVVPHRFVGIAGVVPAFFVSGYTGVLLAATAVPLWTRNYLLMGPLFLASALSSATAAIALVLALARGTSRATLLRLERLDTVALLAELSLLLAARANLGGTLSRPLREGRLGQLFRFGVLGVGLAAPLALQGKTHLRGGQPSPAGTALASLLVLVGGFLLRYVMVMAGRASADDPYATFSST
jgi:formate-dependent nitrite reductase membrane component NrfD